MNSLSIQNMNGTMGKLPGMSRAPKISVEHMRDLGYTMPEEPDWSYPRVEPFSDPSENKTNRRVPEAGETYTAATGPIKPMTLHHQERTLPKRGRPLVRYPIKKFTTNFPHGWMAYEDLRAVANVEKSPSPRGYAPPDILQAERARAIEVAFPEPWAGEDKMTMDVSGLGGFSNLQSALSLAAWPWEPGYWGRPADVPTDPAVAWAAQFKAAHGRAPEKAEVDLMAKHERVLTKEEVAGISALTEKEKKDATPDWLDKVLGFTGAIGTVWMQNQQLKDMEDAAKRAGATQLEIERLRLEQQRLATEAAAIGAAAATVNQIRPKEEKGLFERPEVLVPVGAAAAFAASQLL